MYFQLCDRLGYREKKISLSLRARYDKLRLKKNPSTTDSLYKIYLKNRMYKIRLDISQSSSSTVAFVRLV